ncbi:MAG: hypothetical protein LBS88_02330 [Tannerellaceae bacterium]|nr:hypothetical protein [Tannerellaceae bacterium]
MDFYRHCEVRSNPGCARSGSIVIARYEAIQGVPGLDCFTLPFAMIVRNDDATI